MRRLATAAIVGLATAALVATAAAGAAKDPLLTEVGGAKFPERAFLLALPEDMTLTADRITVTENGEAVSHPTIQPAAAAEDRRFGTVLAIDTSDSMRGRPIEAAMEAARAFAARRNANQELAVVTFNGDVNVVLPFTDDADAIDEVLGTPPTLAFGTEMYDAVDEALALIEASDLASASIVLLSDGNDFGSTTAPSDVIASARDANVRVFSVGLRSRQFDASALRSVADGAGGSFTAADSPEQLEPIFDALGAQLASEYLLRYRSLAGPGENVRVVVRVDGFEEPAWSGYQTPALPKAAPASAFDRSPGDTFWRSGVAMVVAALSSSLLLALAVVALLSQRRRGVVARIAQYVSVAATEGNDAPRRSLGDVVSSGADKSLGRFAWWIRFCEEAEIAKIGIRPAHIVVLTVSATLFTVSVMFVVAGALFAVLGLIVPLLVRGFIKRRLRRQRSLFADQLPDNLQVIGSALRAGHSFVGALSTVVDDSAEPSRSEFSRVVADERLGVPLETALENVARRMDSRDIEQVALVAALQRHSGGNSAEVLDRVAETVRQRGELRRMVQGLTAQGRMARWILSLIPVFLLVVLTLLNRDYMLPLYTESVGRILLFVAAVMVVIGSSVIKRIVDIRV